jgi:hypothetical protein
MTQNEKTVPLETKNPDTPRLSYRIKMNNKVVSENHCEENIFRDVEEYANLILTQKADTRYRYYLDGDEGEYTLSRAERYGVICYEEPIAFITYESYVA